MYTHLHLHTVYSLLDGANRIPELVSKVRDMGQTAVAMTDHGTMAGAVQFYSECTRQGIKPIIGCEVYCAPHGESRKEKGGRNHLVLIAKNREGYRTLCRIVSDAWQEGFYRKPRTDFETLRNDHEGLICLSACLAGAIPQALLNDGYDRALEIAKDYKEVFGDDFYIEVQDHGLPEQKQTNPQLIRIANEIGAKVVATNNAHYLNREDADAQDTLLAIQTKRLKSDTDRMRFETDEFYVKSEDEMGRLFPQEFLDNTQEIADKCEDIGLKFERTHMPDFEIPKGYKNDDEYLAHICMAGMKKRYGQDVPKEYMDRLKYELDTIREMRFAGYFLIVQDFINWSKDHGYPVGPGRGSAAGSIVAYASGITDIDPMKYGLLFERFLNPERVSMPDIDVDFAPDWKGRYHVIDYVRNRYGSDRVSQVATYSLLSARSAFKDVGKAYGLPFSETNRISKLIPMGETLGQALESSPELAEALRASPLATEAYSMAMKEEGMLKSAGKHAGGILIADRPISDYAPLSRSKDPQLDMPVIEYYKADLEELGLVKMDFLGLRNLQVIRDCTDAVKAHTGMEVDMEHFAPEDHPEIFRMLAEGKTYGVFQFESPGITDTLRKMLFDVGRLDGARTQEEKRRLGREFFDRLVAANALFRPGPIDYIPEYIRNMKNPEMIHYDAPQLEPILKSTYGVIVYQEQVQQIFRDLAGYSLGQADVIRRYISKKKIDKMNEQKKIYLYGNLDDNGNPPEGEHPVPGCIRNGISEEAALAIWDKIEKFASYAFNKSHAVSYSYVAAQTAYLKQNFHKEFMAAQLTSFISKKQELSEAVNKVSRGEGISILTPGINESMTGFEATDNGIRFGLEGIKNVGEAVARQIVEEREKNGPFRSAEDFCFRMSGSKLNKKSFTCLAMAGCFDSLGYTRKELVTSAGELMEAAKKGRLRQLSMFDQTLIHRCPEYSPAEKLAMEKETTGLYISGSPLDGYHRAMKEGKCLPISWIHKAALDGRIIENDRVCIGCVIDDIKIRKSRRGKNYMNASIQDTYGSAEIVMFENALNDMEGMPENGDIACVMASVKMDEDGKISFYADRIIPLPPDEVQDISRFTSATKKYTLEWRKRRSEETQALKVHHRQMPGYNDR